MVAALTELYGYRELLRNFLVRDVRVRYKGSALGIVWSLLNPLLLMAVYTVVFSNVMRVHISGGHYPVFFLAGFLPWTFFATTVQMGATSVVANAGLIQKVYFPREVLPLSITGANLVNLMISLAIYLPFAIVIIGWSPLGLVALVFVTCALLLGTCGLAMVLAAAVVYFRDVEFLLAIGLNAWFFLTPVVYQASSVPPQYRVVFALNPVTPFVESFQQICYQASLPPATRLAACAAIGIVGFTLGYTLFNRLKPRLAEEL